MGQVLKASGFLAVFVPLVVMVVGHEVGFEWAPVIMFFGIFPVVRVLSGEKSAEQVDWTETMARALEWLPMVYAVAFVAFYGWVLAELLTWQPARVGDMVGFALSLLLTCALASCVSHELIHKKSRIYKRAGNLIIALAGYPFFANEHLAHHGMPRSVDMAHCSSVSESVWQFAARRCLVAPAEAIKWSNAVRARAVNTSVMESVWFWCGVSCASAVMMTFAGGWFGFILFLVLAVGVPMVINCVAYVQHWGLGIDNGTGGTVRDQVGWDDGCRYQFWTTLGLSMHNAHHEKPSVPYYRLGPSEGKPLLPGGYGIMLLIAMVPPLWRKMMLPRLEDWKTNPLAQQGAGRGVLCLRDTSRTVRRKSAA